MIIAEEPMTSLKLCAFLFPNCITEMIDENVIHDVVDSYQSLLDKVMK